MILMCPCIIDFIGGEWITRVSGGEGALDTPGPLNGTSEGPILLCCIVMEISTGWGRFWGGGGRFDLSLAVR